ncbi:MAG: hypothetical protein WEC33_07465, partial [Dehalococcoidia bacterium]
ATPDVCDPRVDVSLCRLDLSFLRGPEAADRFAEEYTRQRAGGPLADLWFFDLLEGLGPLDHVETWLPGYHDFGLDVDAAETRRRLEGMLERALARAEQS